MAKEMAPSHYLNQCWLIISGVTHSSEVNFKWIAGKSNSWSEFENCSFKIIPISPRAQWVKSLLIRPRGNHPRATKLDIACLVPSHCLKQCTYYQSIHQEPTLEKLNENTKIFMQENSFENVVCKLSAIFFRPQCVDFPYLCFHRTHRILHMRPCGHFDNVIEVVSVDVVFIHKGYNVRYTFRLLLGQRWRQFTSHLWKVIHGQRFFVSWDAEITRLRSLHINALVLDYRNSSAFTLQLPVLDLAIDIPDQLNPWH